MLTTEQIEDCIRKYPNDPFRLATEVECLTIKESCKYLRSIPALRRSADPLQTESLYRSLRDLQCEGGSALQLNDCLNDAEPLQEIE